MYYIIIKTAIGQRNRQPAEDTSNGTLKQVGERMIPLGKIIRELRDEHHLSQQQLAQKIGVTKSTVGLYESGDRFPSLNTLIELSRSFGVSTDYLLGLDKQKSYYLDISDLTPKQIHSINLVIENFRNLRN